MTNRKLVYLSFLLGAFIFSFFLFELTQPSSTAKAQTCTPGVLISKEVRGDDLRIFPIGSDVSFEITVQNTGDVELTNLFISDPLVPDCERTFASLEVGGTINYSCTAVAVMQGFQNVAKVTAESSCGGVTDIDTSAVNLAGIAVSKQEKGEDSRVFSAGEDVTFTIVVTNTGEIDLTNITVSDPLVPNCARVIDSLLVGEHTTYECTENAVTVGFTNVVTATTSVNGFVLSDNDPSTVKIPSIDIRKQAEGADSRSVLSGSDVTFDIVVTNTGDVDLTNVEVSDPLAPDCDRVIGSLAVGESESYSCTVENVTEGFTNIATVTGDDGELTVTDEDPSTIKIPAIDIRKQAEGEDTRTIAFGSDVTFDIVVTNTGEVDLANVEVSDPLAPDCDRVIGSLAVGESESYSCTVENVTEGFTNIATVTGDDGDLTVTDDDPSTIEIDEYNLYLPIILDEGVTNYDVSFGYEDLRLDQGNDFDYNDWVVRVNTDFNYNSIVQETIYVDRVTFEITPQARGALLAHEYHFSLPANTFGSNGVATLTVVGPSGNTLKFEQTAFIASQSKDFKVFDLTSDAIPPSTLLVNTIEGGATTQPQQTAEIIIQFDNTFGFVLTDFGPHGEGLFFEPYLRVMPSGAANYDIGNGDLRTIVFPIADWRWPEEMVRIDRAYPGITYVGSPQMFTFPDGWWLNHNQCVFGDGVVCP